MNSTKLIKSCYEPQPQSFDNDGEYFSSIDELRQDAEKRGIDSYRIGRAPLFGWYYTPEVDDDQTIA